MELYPAIDLKDGKCVRLLQGEFDTVQTVAADPVECARRYRDQGACIIHVVDLDGALDGHRKNAALVREIVQAAYPAKIELGGGLRSLSDLAEADALGVFRMILGSAAVTDRAFVREALARYDSRIAVGIDAKDGFVKTHGWTADSGIPEIDFVREMVSEGVRVIIYTDISTDGTLKGPSLERLSGVRALLPPETELVASGGVANVSDIQALRKMGAHAAIAGKALYSETLDLTEGLCEARYGHLFDKQELVPAIIQHDETGAVLMLGYMNRLSFQHTINTGNAVFWSRSRQKLWMKGETSGHFLHLRSILTDCDRDTLLLRCIPQGPTCHTGAQSCFYQSIYDFNDKDG